MAATDQQVDVLLTRLEELQLELRRVRQSLSQRWLDDTELRLPIHALVVLIGGLRYAIPVEMVRIVSPMVLVSPLRGAPSSVRGVIAYQSNLVPLLDIVARETMEPRKLGLELYITVLRTGQRLIALVVDEIDDVHLFEQQQLAPQERTSSLPAMVRAVFNLADQPVHLLEPALVLAASELDMLDELMLAQRVADGEGAKHVQRA